MRNKTRFQFVDEFRKINCIQKLAPIQNLHPDEEEDAKQENNKFIRYKQEILLEGLRRDEDYLYNQIVTGYKVDIENDCSQIFTAKNTNISNDIDYFRSWSDTLNKEIKDRDYMHKFFFKEANPPPRLKKEEQAGKDKTSNGRNANEEIMSDKNENHNNDTTSLQLPQRGKYNFHQITKHLYAKNRQLEDKDNTFLRDLTIKNQIAELRKLKNLAQIDKIGQFNDEFNKFAYYIEPQEDRIEIQYVDNSIVRGNNPLPIDYFRDIGTPSRQILQYTISKQKKMNIEEEKGMDLESDYRQESRELLYLYFLREEELKINKNEMTFYDIANMSMGRVTSNNAHMCVRNEKVTKAQYTKLLKKMQKYDLRQNESNKHKQDKLIGTQQIEQTALNNNAKGQQEIEDKEGTANIQNIIDEINKIRKEVKLFEDKNAASKINKSNFNNEIYLKLEMLLNLLYDLVTEKMRVKYPINQIGMHLSQISGTNELGYDQLRVLWYIANCYDEMMAKQTKAVDLRTLGSMQSKQEPSIIKYKGKKVIGEDSIQTKKVYGFNMVDKDKNKSPAKFNPKTPTKGNRTPIKAIKTPTKNSNNTGSKLNTGQQSTVRKAPYTAKK